ncbi:hypothetical protein ACGF5M_00090 [Gemmatimonadota bacterium]
MTNKHKPSIAIALAALNLTIGGVVSWLKLPIYLDSIGLVLSTVLLGWRYGLLTGVITVSIGFLLINPYLPAYTLTLFSLVATTELLARRKAFRSIPTSIAAGLLLALVAATVSAPVTTYLFGGVTASGVDLITVALRQTGRTLLDSVLLSGISSELLDKTLVSMFSCIILKSLPARFFLDFKLRSQTAIVEAPNS